MNEISDARSNPGLVDSPPAAPPRAKTQAQVDLEMGRAILGIAYPGMSQSIDTSTGETHAFNARSEAEKVAAREETQAGVEAAGVEFAKLRNQLALMQASMAKQNEEIAWLRTSREAAGKKSKSKGKK